MARATRPSGVARLQKRGIDCVMSLLDAVMDLLQKRRPKRLAV
jgi:hypothetical protein